MKNMKCWILLFALLTLAILVPGCRGKKSTRAINELKAPEAAFITSSLTPWKEAHLVLLNDGKFRVMTEEDETMLDLLEWEYRLSKDYFKDLKAEYQEAAATATPPEWHEGDPYPGTQIDWHQYDDVDYKKYAEDSTAMRYYKEYFDDNTYKLKKRPDVRVRAVLIYSSDDLYYSMSDEEIGKCYQRGFEIAFEDPEMKEALLSSVNADAYSTGNEATEIEIVIKEDEYRNICIRVIVNILDPDIGEASMFDKIEQWK
ncbi:MAG: hypothetical protein IKG93_09015 [Clostridiales bacterium]|nr:hypothetical protein [Clostridiales bacterium]